MKRIKIILIIGIVFSLLLGYIGFSYAFYKTEILGINNTSSINVSFKELKVKFMDTNAINGSKISPGWTQTKTFSIQNDGDEAVSYNILWTELVNTLVNKDLLTYTLTCTQTGANITKTSIPTSQSDVSIINNISIDKGITHTYTLSVTYAEIEGNQGADMGKTFSGKIKIS
ncbi:MAG: hypothetical protein RR228_00330 [Bacilli bacterium]